MKFNRSLKWLMEISEQITLDIRFMDLALAQAQLAHDVGEVPVGAVLVRAGQVLASGFNSVIKHSDPSAHAEIVALRAAGQIEQNYRLPKTTMYVTLEPCPMCLSAMFHARLERVVYGASDPKTGACGGQIDLRRIAINHHTQVEGSVLEDECGALLQGFFKQRRLTAKRTQVASAAMPLSAKLHLPHHD